MWNHARLDETLAMFVEIDAPRIACTFGKQLKNAPSRMETPNAGGYGGALARRRSWFANVRMREHTVTTVKPAVRSPAKRIQCFVRILIAPPVQENFRRSFWFGHIAVGDWYEHQIRRCPDPDPAETDLQAAHQV